MIQDLPKHKYHVEFKQQQPLESDYLLSFYQDQVLLECIAQELYIPTIASINTYYSIDQQQLLYLFSIDEHAFYLYSVQKLPAITGFEYQHIKLFRTFTPTWKAFAGITANQLYRWYNTHQYCGKCGTLMTHSDHERALFCDHCKITNYPQIAPAVILGIIDGDRLLLSKYAGRPYGGYALIAGFTEIGESFEETCKREAMEEVGLKIKNIRYYKSQPWAFSDTILAGFFADIDGDTTITLDETELAEAGWFKRDELPTDASLISLTQEMIEVFRSDY